VLKRSGGTTRAPSRNSTACKPASTKHQPRPDSRREFIALRDLSECLLDAYDFVAQRAYEKFIDRGNLAGDDLADWLSAERELLPKLSADVQDSEKFVYALVSIPGPKSRRISVGIESRWLVVLAHSQGENNTASIRADGVPCDGIVEEFESAPGVSPIACVMELPAEVDPATSTVIRCDKLLGIRMPKFAKPGFEESAGARN
jgi:hypothetical protein